MRLAAEDDHVTPLSLAQDVPCGVTDVLEHGGGQACRGTARAKVLEEGRPAAMVAREQCLVAVPRARASSRSRSTGSRRAPPGPLAACAQRPSTATFSVRTLSRGS